MRNSILFLLIAFTFSCNPGKTPEGIYEKETMVSVLIGLHMAEARVKSLELPPDSAMAYYLFQQGEIFEEYNIDTASYRKSFEYYSKEIGKLDEIYEEVLDSLNYINAVSRE